jgi:uncharacterized SAM-binding protein YcdF (DUF218 family)
LIELVRTLLLPPFSLFLIYGIGLLLPAGRLGSTLRNGSVVLLYLLCTSFGAGLLVSPLEGMEGPLISTRHKTAQAIVVLAAGRLRNSPEYNNEDIPDYIALARLRYAAKLYHETGLPVLVSGGVVEQHIEPLAYAMARALRNDFVTPVKWIENHSSNTAENAINSAQLLNMANIHRIYLVTDAMHMHRARLMFEKQHIEVIAASTMYFSKSMSRFGFIPMVENLRLSNYAIYEWLGLAWYRLRY